MKQGDKLRCTQEFKEYAKARKFKQRAMDWFRDGLEVMAVRDNKVYACADFYVIHCCAIPIDMAQRMLRKQEAA